MLDEFLTYIACELRLSANTVAAYRRDLRQWHDYATRPPHDRFTPELYTVNDLRLWIASLATAGDSPRTVRRKVQSLRAFYAFMMRRHGLTANPAAELTPARIPKDLPVNVRPAETAAMLDRPLDLTSLSEVRARLIVDMLYQTGMRCTELITLRDAAVDTAAGELKVAGKRNKERIIPFGPELSRLITIYRTLRDATASPTDGTFFARDDGRPLYRKMVYNTVHGMMADCGVHAARLSPHVLRHSCATDLLNAGADLTSVRQLLGHASLATTQIYTHISYRDLQHNYQLAHPRAQKK